MIGVRLRWIIRQPGRTDHRGVVELFPHNRHQPEMLGIMNDLVDHVAVGEGRAIRRDEESRPRSYRAIDAFWGLLPCLYLEDRFSRIGLRRNECSVLERYDSDDRTKRSLHPEPSPPEHLI